MTDLQDQPSISGLYLALDHIYGSAMVSKGLAYVAALPNDDLVVPMKRYEMVAAFCRGYRREEQEGAA